MTRSNSSVSVYTFTHKPFEAPIDPMYVPLFVGAALHDDNQIPAQLRAMRHDNTGDHISEKNDTFSELTGLYWAWKNADADLLGTAHYRRYLLNEKGALFNATDIRAILEGAPYDLIVTKELELNFSYKYGFSKNHKPYYLVELEKVISDLYPAYLPTYQTLVEGKHTYFGNMFICRRSLFDAYCTWLFSILFEMESRITIEEADSYHRRIFGFISEFLLYIYVKHHRFRAYETMVGMVGEKAEVTEIKKELARLLEAGDYKGAKVFFLDAHKKRPDILLEASDITNELHLSMEAISIAEFEADAMAKNGTLAGDAVGLMDKNLCFADLMGLMRRLNKQAQTGTLENFQKENRLSDEAVFVAMQLIPKE